MFRENANPADKSPATGMLWLVVAVLAAAFFLTEHQWNKSQLHAYAFEVDVLEHSAGGGYLPRQIGFLSLAGLGLLLLLRPGGTRPSLADPLAWPLVALAVWSVASIAWSADPGVTIRRVIVLLCCLTAALGLARQFEPRRLGLIALGATGALVLLGVVAELSLGTFRPWAADYRFAGTLHPNSQGCYCAIAMTAAVALALESPRRRRFVVLAFVFGALLLLTKSRTCLAAAMLAAVLVWFVSRWNLGRLAAVAVMGTVAGAYLLGTTLAGGDLVEKVASAVLLGRQEQAATLNGRLPLWNELLYYSSERPWLGYGYASFWTSARIADISEKLQWAIPGAHSSYFDILLGTGRLGLGLAILAVVGGLARALLLFRRTGLPSAGFLAALLAFGMLNGLAESTFARPMLVTLLAGCALVRLAVFAPATSAEPLPETTSRSSSNHGLHRSTLSGGVMISNPLASEAPTP
jgi:O-antigen ligase